MFLPFWGAGVSFRSGRPTPGRLVEAQHKVSTARLVPPEHQARLEQIIEETEAVYQAGCDHLDDLLRTPFRYRPEHGGSRWRRQGQVEGAAYYAAQESTAVAETFWRLLFLHGLALDALPGCVPGIHRLHGCHRSRGG